MKAIGQDSTSFGALKSERWIKCYWETVWLIQDEAIKFLEVEINLGTSRFYWMLEHRWQADVGTSVVRCPGGDYFHQLSTTS